MLNKSRASCLVMVKSAFALQDMLMSQFQELVVSMSPKYIWKAVYLGGIPALLTPSTDPVSTELLPDLSVARGNKGYTGDIVQPLVITGLFSMTAIPRHSPFLSRAVNRTTNAECCFCSQKRSNGWIHSRLCKCPRNKCYTTATLLLSWVFTPSLLQLKISSLIIVWLLLAWLKLNVFNLKGVRQQIHSPVMMNPGCENKLTWEPW